MFGVFDEQQKLHGAVSLKHVVALLFKYSRLDLLSTFHKIEDFDRPEIHVYDERLRGPKYPEVPAEEDGCYIDFKPDDPHLGLFMACPVRVPNTLHNMMSDHL